MRRHSVEVVVVGGGAAGVAAATAAARAGARTLLIEREEALGGVLDQCIHPGFGLHRYREELTGPEFAHRLVAELAASGAEVWTGSTVLGLGPSRPAARVVAPAGLVHVRAKAVVWAAGAWERPVGALLIPGTRPCGVFTAGLAQRLVNIHGLLPGRRALVLGSGDIGLIMARRLHLEGVEVVGVLELRPYPGGLLRNVVQCLDDFGIPLHLSHTVSALHGRDRLSGVTVVEVDERGRPIAGSEEHVEVDTLILSVGLIPETRVIEPWVPRDPINGGADVDGWFRTRIPWLFSAGNAVAVFDLVDTVARVGERAGLAAARHAHGDLPTKETVPLVRGGSVGHLVPTSLVPGVATTLFVRARGPLPQARVEVGPSVAARCVGVRPAEMIEVDLSAEQTMELARLPEARVEVMAA